MSAEEDLRTLLRATKNHLQLVADETHRQLDKVRADIKERGLKADVEAIQKSLPAFALKTDTADVRDEFNPVIERMDRAVTRQQQDNLDMKTCVKAFDSSLCLKASK